MGASKNWGTPKWMVKINGNPYVQMDDLGGKTHHFWKHPHIPLFGVFPQEKEKKFTEVRASIVREPKR